MYKKITHTIVEEHFDHPIANQIKKSISRSELTNDEIFSESKFRSDVHDYITKYLTSLTGIIDSVNGTEEDLYIAFDNAFSSDSWIDGLGNMTKPIYPSLLGERISESMRRIIMLTFFWTRQVRMGTDTQYTTDGYDKNIREVMAPVLSNFNFQWSAPVIIELFIDIGKVIVDLLKAKQKKDSSAEKLAADKLSSLFLKFENFFVDGIIKQHPERFSLTATLINTKLDQRDIM